MRGRPIAGDDVRLQSLDLRPLAGGHNNAVFVACVEGATVCLKVYRVDDRRRGWREWQALTLLHRRLPGLAPAPLGYDASAEPDVVVMEFIEGAQPGGETGTPAWFEALFQRLSALHAIRPADDTVAVLQSAGTPAAILARLRDWAGTPAPPTPQREIEAVHALAARWLSDSAEARELEAPAPAIFSRGDPYLNNCLWRDGHMWLIDWENSGWSERAYELADYVEHIEARAIPDADWLAFVDRFTLSGAARRRFAASRRLLALFWCMTLARRLTDDLEMPARFRRQFDRTRRLLAESSA